MKKRLLASFLSIMMVLTLLPATAMAEGSTADVADRKQLAEALSNEAVSVINLTNDIDMGDEFWTPAEIGAGRELAINGGGFTIRNMKVNAGILKPSGSGVAGDGGSCDYYAGFIGNNKGTLTISDLKFDNALVDMDPVSINEKSTGSSILAVVCANNMGALVYDQVEVSGSTVKGYSKVGVLHGFTQKGSFVANQCTVTGNTVVLEADGSDKEAAPSGVLIGYDGSNLAKTNGIKMQDNIISIDESVDWGEVAIQEKEDGTKFVEAYNSIYCLISPTYTHGNSSDSVAFVAEVGGYQYETVQDAINAANDNDVVTLLKSVTEEDIQINTGKTFTLDLNGLKLSGYADLYSGFVTVTNGTFGGYTQTFNVYTSDDESLAAGAYNSLTIAEDVTIGSNGKNYGITLRENETDKTVGYGSKIDVYGKINDNIWVMGNIKKGNSEINVHNGAKIIVTDDGAGIALQGAAKLTVDGYVEGGTGIENRGGELVVNENSEIIGISHPTSVTPNGNGTTTTGAGIAIAQHTTKLPVSVTVNGGKVSGYTGLYLTNPQKNDEVENVTVEIKGGAFAAINGGKNAVAKSADSGTAVGDATAATLLISGGNFTSDPSAFLAEGYTVTQGEAGYAYQVVEKTATTVPVEPAVADPSVPKAEDLKNDPTVKIEEEDITKVIDAAKSVEAPDLAAAAGSEANSITEKEATALVDKANITPAEGEEVKLYVQTFLDVQPKEYNETDGTLKLEITPKYQIVASKAENADGIDLGDETHSVVVQEALPTEVSTTVIMSLTLPTEFVSGTPSIYVQHSKDGVTYVYDTVLDSNTITFENPHGFSTFVVTKTAPVAKIGNIGYTSLQDAVDKVKDNETIVLEADNAEKVLVSQAVVFTLDKNGKDFTGSISAATGYKLENEGDVYTVTRVSTDEGTVTQTYAITVEKSEGGSVTSNFNKAAKDRTIKLTVAAEEGYKLDKLTVEDSDGTKIALTEEEDGTYTFTMPASDVTVKATFVAEGEAVEPFTDVKAGDWFYDAVHYVYDKGMMNGDAGKFSPNNNLTRGMIAQVLYNLEGKPEAGESAFTDVASDAWYAEAVNWAAEQGIVSGYGNGLFGPEDDITREQMALILYKYAELKGYDVTVKGDLTAFTDGEETSDWAKEAVEWAVGAKLISGKGNGQLDPIGTAIRAEVAQILMGFCENVVK